MKDVVFLFHIANEMQTVLLSKLKGHLEEVLENLSYEIRSWSYRLVKGGDLWDVF